MAQTFRDIIASAWRKIFTRKEIRRDPHIGADPLLIQIPDSNPNFSDLVIVQDWHTLCLTEHGPCLCRTDKIEGDFLDVIDPVDPIRLTIWEAIANSDLPKATKQQLERTIVAAEEAELRMIGVQGRRDVLNTTDPEILRNVAQIYRKYETTLATFEPALKLMSDKFEAVGVPVRTVSLTEAGRRQLAREGRKARNLRADEAIEMAQQPAKFLSFRREHQAARAA